MIKNSEDEYRTGNYALTTVLATLGYPWKYEQPCTNKYSNGERPQRGKDGRLAKLGRVLFYLSKTSTGYPGAKIEDVIKAYDGETTPGDDLDAQLASDKPDIAEIRRLVPLAIAEGCRNALANLRVVKDAPHKVKASILFRKPDGMPIIVNEDANEELQARWGVKL